MQDTLKVIILSPNPYLSLSFVVPTLIGLLSIFVTGGILMANRRHYRLGVRPIADVAAKDYETRLSVILSNRGTGPLTIRSFTASKGGESRTDLISWMPNLPPGVSWSDFHSNIDGTSLRPSDEIPLIEIDIDEDNPKHRRARDIVRQALKDITIRIEYADIYDRVFVFPGHLLSWFGRHDEGANPRSKKKN
jgi:hypothetical protein